MSQAMKTFRCPTCSAVIEVLSCVIGATCDGGGRHRAVKMGEMVEHAADRNKGKEET